MGYPDGFTFLVWQAIQAGRRAEPALSLTLPVPALRRATCSMPRASFWPRELVRSVMNMASPSDASINSY
jgi:hypothetical protein